MTTMKIKERPIIFSGLMVRAILEGRKTQTRRVVKPQPTDDPSSAMPWVDEGPTPSGAGRVGRSLRLDDCPYGVLGDQLWVKETWAEIAHTSPVTMEPVLCKGDRLIEHAESDGDGGWYYGGKVICYIATSPIEFVDGNGFADGDKNDTPRWKSPLFMPRWASRILLEVTKVRVERVQTISEEDARAEGVTPGNYDRPDCDCNDEDCQLCAHLPALCKPAFAHLWDSINAKYGYGWNANPWVWAVTFRRIERTA